MFLDQLKEEAGMTYTENGAVTYRTSGSEVLDLFATIGALRHADQEEIEQRFLRAYAEDPDLAMKCLFYARDIRGGLGERRVFRVILNWLARNRPGSVVRNMAFIGEMGRFDDVLCLLDTPCASIALAYVAEVLQRDREAMEKGEQVSLLGKWLPSVNASSAETVRLAKRVARALNMNDAQYRRTLTALRGQIRILENSLRERDYTFDYGKQPSRALFRYRKAFQRNDGERYQAFLTRVAEGKAVLRTGALAPYEIIRPILAGSLSEEGRKSLDVTWNAQEDFTGGENALVVIDGSGSMYGGGEPRPAEVALSLGIYFAEHNTGLFRNHFITFSTHPRLVEIRGADILEKVMYCSSFNEVADTNLEAVFELLLDTAVKNHAAQEDLPVRLYIISDMEFNSCVRDGSRTNFENAKMRYAQHGYRLPEVVFWNVQSRNSQQPVKKNEQGVTLVSGCTPRIFSMLAGRILDPYHFMLEVLRSERYGKITA